MERPLEGLWRTYSNFHPTKTAPHKLGKGGGSGSIVPGIVEGWRTGKKLGQEGRRPEGGGEGGRSICGLGI